MKFQTEKMMRDFFKIFFQVLLFVVWWFVIIGIGAFLGITIEKNGINTTYIICLIIYIIFLTFTLSIFFYNVFKEY